MQNTNMNFEEVKEFSEYVVRRATASEVELITSHCAVMELQARQNRGELPDLKSLPDTLIAIIKEQQDEIGYSAMVHDFKHCGKRIVSYSRPRLTAQQHDSLHNHIMVVHHYFTIDEDDNVQYTSYNATDLCLYKTQKQENV